MRKNSRKGSGHTSLDPEVHKPNPSAPPRRDLAKEALAAQAERKRVKAEAAKAEAEEPPERSRKSSESSASDPTEFHENPLLKLRGQKSEPSANFKGKVGENSDPKISFFGVQRHTKGARRSRKNKKRKTRRRR